MWDRDAAESCNEIRWVIFFPPYSAISCFEAPRRAIEFGHQNVITGLADGDSYHCASGMSMQLRNTYANITCKSDKRFNSKGKSKYYVTFIIRTVTADEAKALSFLKEIKLTLNDSTLIFPGFRVFLGTQLFPAPTFNNNKRPHKRSLSLQVFKAEAKNLFRKLCY